MGEIARKFKRQHERGAGGTYGGTMHLDILTIRQARLLDEQIAAAVAAAMKAQAEAHTNGSRKPPAPPALEPTNDTDPSWCPIHRVKMERRTNERGSWYSHRLAGGGYCKGE